MARERSVHPSPLVPWGCWLPAVGVLLFGGLKRSSLEHSGSLWLMSRCRGGPSSPAAGKPLNPNHSREHVGFRQPEFHLRVFPLSVGPQGPTPLPGEEREPSPNPERRNPRSSVGSRKLFRDQDPPGVRFCPSTSHPRRQPLAPTVAAPTAVV